MKIEVGERRRTFIGGWVLAALLVLGHNGMNLMGLLDEPLLGYPAEIKGIRQQWRLLEQLRSLAVRDVEAESHLDLDEIFARFEPLPADIPENLPPSGEAPATRVEGGREGPILPVLTGVVCVSDEEGKVRSFALFYGKRYRVGDRVMGFRIRKISEKGVELEGMGSKWFLPVRQDAFSVVRGDEAG